VVALAARRLLSMIPILIIVSVIVFALGQLIPGDPAITLAGEHASAELIARIREQLGLDQPLWKQYVDWLAHAATGDLGTSIQTARPVTTEVLKGLPATLFLAFSSLLIAVILGGALGTVAAVRPKGLADRVVTALASLFVSVPGFVFALILVAIFSIGLGLLPATGFRLPSQGVGDAVRYVVLPAIALSLGSAGEFALQVRSAVRASLGSEYALALQSRQVGRARIVFRHSMRNAAIPLTTVIALLFNHILGAAVVVEIIFAIPGIGALAVSAVTNADLPMIQGVVIVFAVLTLLANLICDLLYGVLDPRVRS
jgi:peptide/nickel transport system permease protein